jgi:hypothetical protein
LYLAELAQKRRMKLATLETAFPIGQSRLFLKRAIAFSLLAKPMAKKRLAFSLELKTGLRCLRFLLFPAFSLSVISL